MRRVVMRWALLGLLAGSSGCDTTRTVPARDAGPDATPVNVLPPLPAVDRGPEADAAGDAGEADGGAA